MKDKLIEKQREYIELLGKEINELGVPAYVHGWRSKRYEQGVKIRDEISALEKQIEDKSKFTTCPDCGSDMFSTVLTHYKCRKCKKQFTN